MRRWLKSAMIAGGVALAGLGVADRLAPPDLSRVSSVSVDVLDASGARLQTYLSADGMVRVKTTPSEVDPRYLAMLVAYEDKRFWDHWGVDPIAMVRAIVSSLKAGRIVSGGSTLTMQTARLLEPRPRTVASKLIEMARAVQLEAHFTKQEILGLYLTLAPMGGNKEGVEAAARSYFGHGAERLSLTEAALLVALPQSPTRLRPDRHPGAARNARNAVLKRTAHRMELAPGHVASLTAERLKLRLSPLADHAFHAGARVRAAHRGEARIETSLIAGLQSGVRHLVQSHAGMGDPETAAAAIVIDNQTRRILAYIGAPDAANARRHGAIDMVRAVRSPGSTLKPFIYGMAMDEGLVHPHTLINDAPTQFGDYAPKNFRDRHYGEISMADALRRSLNVPAVAVLDRLGPVRFAARLGRAGVPLNFHDPAARPGLAIGLGGVGLTLEDVASLYAALADDGIVRPLRLTGASRDEGAEPVLSAWARWHLGEILRASPPPDTLLADTARAVPRAIAYKTGTSYGFRDAWAFGFTPRYTVGVWVGRADGTPSPGRFGANTAAPLLFDIFDALPPGDLPQQPFDVADLTPFASLPPGLQTLDGEGGRFAPGAPPPRIVFPRRFADLVLPPAGVPLVLEAEGGEGALTWFVNGLPHPASGGGTKAQWLPDGPGFAEFAVIDQKGRRSGVRVRLIEPGSVFALTAPQP